MLATWKPRFDRVRDLATVILRKWGKEKTPLRQKIVVSGICSCNVQTSRQGTDGKQKRK